MTMPKQYDSAKGVSDPVFVDLKGKGKAVTTSFLGSYVSDNLYNSTSAMLRQTNYLSAPVKPLYALCLLMMIGT